MTPRLWSRVRRVFDQAVELVPDRRRSLLDRDCAGDATLRREVETMLEAHDRAGRFLSAPEEALSDMAEQVPEQPPLGAAGEAPLPPGCLVARRYRVISILGRGGSSVVYQVDDGFGRRCALKLLHREAADQEAMRRRFQREVRLYGQSSHPDLPRLFDWGEWRGRPYCLFELVRGASLRQVLRERSRLDSTTVIRLGIQACSMLEALHRRGIVHRDVKPQNLILDDRDRLHLVDFGLARMTGPDAGSSTAPGAFLGTPEYMSPEQLRGETADPLSDLYSLGLVLFELVAGRHPFASRSLLVVIWRQLLTPPPPLKDLCPELEHGLCAAVEQCLAKRAPDRHPSVRHLRRTLETLQGERSAKHTISFRVG